MSCSDDDTYLTPKKRAKTTTKRSCNYRIDWQRDFTWLKKDESNKENAFCSLCLKTFSVAHGGRNDVTKHEKSAEHNKKQKAAQTSKSLSSFFPSQFTPQNNKITATELTLALHTVKHNQSFNSLQCQNHFYETIFPDSSIASKLELGKHKNHSFLNNLKNIN